MLRDTTVPGGLEQAVHLSAERLESAGFSVEVCSLRVRPRGLTSWARLSDRLRHSTQTGNALRTCDTVHFHAPTATYWSTPLVLLARALNKKIFLTVHLPSEPIITGRKRRRVRNLCDVMIHGLVARVANVHVLAPGATSSRLLQKRYCNFVTVRSQKNFMRQIAPAPFPPFDRLRIAYIGRLTPQKNLVALLDAVERLDAQGLRTSCDIVGEGISSDELASMVRNNASLRRAVTFYGHRTNIEQFLSRCHVLVLPSHHEGAPLVAMEAAAVGRPTCCRQGLEGMEDYLPGAHLEVTDVDDGRSLAAALVQWSAGPQIFEQTGQRAREVYERSWTDDSVLDSLLTTYGYEVTR